MSGSSNSGLFGIDTRRWTGLWDVQQDRRKTEHVTSRNSNREKKNDPRLHNVQATKLRATSHEHSRLVWLTVYSVWVNVLLSAVFLSVKMVKHTQIIYITKTEVTPFYYKYTICITNEYLELGITNMFVFQGRYRFFSNQGDWWPIFESECQIQFIQNIVYLNISATLYTSTKRQYFTFYSTTCIGDFSLFADLDYQMVITQSYNNNLQQLNTHATTFI